MLHRIPYWRISKLVQEEKYGKIGCQYPKTALKRAFFLSMWNCSTPENFQSSWILSPLNAGQHVPETVRGEIVPWSWIVRMLVPFALHEYNQSGSISFFNEFQLNRILTTDWAIVQCFIFVWILACCWSSERPRHSFVCPAASNATLWRSANPGSSSCLYPWSSHAAKRRLG